MEQPSNKHKTNLFVVRGFGLIASIGGAAAPRSLLLAWGSRGYVRLRERAVLTRFQLLAELHPELEGILVHVAGILQEGVMSWLLRHTRLNCCGGRLEGWGKGEGRERDGRWRKERTLTVYRRGQLG